MTGGWAEYPWPPAIALSSAMIVFTMHLVAERYVEKKHNIPHHVEECADQVGDQARTTCVLPTTAHQSVNFVDQSRPQPPTQSENVERKDAGSLESGDIDSIEAAKDKAADIAFKQQIAAFLVLEFGVLLHSAIIGLTLGTAGSEFAALFPVIVFHQAFEGG